MLYESSFGKQSGADSEGGIIYGLSGPCNSELTLPGHVDNFPELLEVKEGSI